jgi:hypothetical protein
MDMPWPEETQTTSYLDYGYAEHVDFIEGTINGRSFLIGAVDDEPATIPVYVAVKPRTAVLDEIADDQPFLILNTQGATV